MFDTFRTIGGNINLVYVYILVLFIAMKLLVSMNECNGRHNAFPKNTSTFRIAILLRWPMRLIGLTFISYHYG